MTFIVYCVKNDFARRCAFLCFPNLQMKVDHADKQIFHWNPKATSLALFARVEGFFICRVIFKSHVKPLLRVCTFIQPREDMKIKTDQSLNACPVTYVGVALRNRKLSPPPHIHLLQLNAGAFNYLLFSWTLCELFRFFQQRLALNAGKKKCAAHEK